MNFKNQFTFLLQFRGLCSFSRIIKSTNFVRVAKNTPQVDYIGLEHNDNPNLSNL